MLRFHTHAKPHLARSWHSCVAHAYCGGGQHSATNTQSSQNRGFHIAQKCCQKVRNPKSLSFFKISAPQNMLRTFFVAIYRTLRFGKLQKVWENFGDLGGFLTLLAVFCYHHVLRLWFVGNSCFPYLYLQVSYTVFLSICYYKSIMCMYSFR